MDHARLTWVFQKYSPRAIEFQPWTQLLWLLLMSLEPTWAMWLVGVWCQGWPEVIFKKYFTTGEEQTLTHLSCWPDPVGQRGCSWWGKIHVPCCGCLWFNVCGRTCPVRVGFSFFSHIFCELRPPAIIRQSRKSLVTLTRPWIGSVGWPFLFSFRKWTSGAGEKAEVSELDRWTLKSLPHYRVWFGEKYLKFLTLGFFGIKWK